jgi:hypothetical protein
MRLLLLCAVLLECAHADADPAKCDAGAAVCEGVCSEPEVMHVLEHMPPRQCLVEKGTSLLEPFNTQGPGFRAASCEARVFSFLSGLQDTDECEAVAAAGFMNYGLGSTVLYLVLQLQRAIRDRRPIAFVGEWVYGGCEARDFSCALEPLSRCNLTGIPSLVYPRMEAEQLPWDIGGEFSKCSEWGGRRGRGGGDALEEAGRGGEGERGGLAEFAGGRNSLFHFVSTLSGFIFRPNAVMRRAAAAAQDKIGLPRRYLAVHVRNGDFCIAHTVTSDRKQCHSLPSFAEALQRLASAYSLYDVYLATDNADAIGTMQALSPDLVFYWRQDVDRDFMVVTADDIERREIFLEQRLFRADLRTRQRHLQDIMVDILLLAGSEAFVGHFSSNVSRLVVALGTFLRGGTLMPFVSLDIPWCWGGGRPTDISGFGVWQC